MLRNKDALVVTPPTSNLQYCVVVPAKNEEELLPSALRSLAEQKTLTGAPLGYEVYEVILLINNCTDRSRQIAERFRRLYASFRLHIAEHNFSESNAHVGSARRLLMDEAYRRLQMVGHPNAAILSTDADSQVASNWIARNQEELASGAEAVGGRLIISGSERELLDPVALESYRYDHLYRRLVCWMEDRQDPETRDPWPRHHHHFGASLAVKPEVYKAVGRLPPRRRFEDVAFYDALVRHDVRLSHSNKVRVFTSARLAGRGGAGLSTQLSDWTKAGKNAIRMPVESGAFLEHMFATRRQLRLLWLNYRETDELPAAQVQDLAETSGIKISQLSSKIRAARSFGMLVERLSFYKMCRNTWPDRIRLAPLRHATDELLQSFKAAMRARSRVRARQCETGSYDSLIANAILSAPENGRVRHLREAQTPEQVLTSAQVTGGH
jgi:Glycosyl transferase family 2